MATIQKIKDRLIDRIMMTKNKQLLNAIDDILDSIHIEEKITLTSEQKELLMMSEREIEQDDLISEADLKQSDSEWMN